MSIAGEVKHPIRHDGCRVDRRAHIRAILLLAVPRGFAENFLFLAGGEHHQVAIFVPDVNLAVRHQRRAPHVRLHVVSPIVPARFSIEAMHETGKVVDEEQSVRCDGNRRYAAVTMPACGLAAENGNPVIPRHPNWDRIVLLDELVYSRRVGVASVVILMVIRT